MALETTKQDSSNRKPGLLKKQVQLVKKKGCDRYSIMPIQENLSFEKGFFAVIQACQLLTQNNNGIIIVGLAGPSGSGKTVFTEKVLNFKPNVAVISMDNYNDATRLVDGNFDDPRLTDYTTLLKNINDLKEGKSVEIPIYDFKTSSRIGYRTLEVPLSRIVIIEGIYALSEKLRPLLDLQVSVTGGIHVDLVKRVLRDIQRAGQEPSEIIQQISETVYPMYKAYIEPDLKTAHIKIINKFNPFTGLQRPTYILKSPKKITVEDIKSVFSEDHTETMEETYDIYLLPPGEDPETCQSYLRMRNKEGKYNLMFEEWVVDDPFVISPRITFGVSVRLLGGLMSLGYTIASILKRNSHVFTDERVSVKIDLLEQLNRQYVQVQGKDRIVVKCIAEQLGLEGSYIPRTYIEQIQLEKLVNEVMALPEDLKTQLSIDEEDLVSSPKEALRNKMGFNTGMSRSFPPSKDSNYSGITDFRSTNQRFEDGMLERQEASKKEGDVALLTQKICRLNTRMDELNSRIEDVNSKLSSGRGSPYKFEGYNGSIPTSYLINGVAPQFAKHSPIMEELAAMAYGQRQIMHQLDNLSNLVRVSIAHQARTNEENAIADDIYQIRGSLLLTIVVGGLGILLFNGLPRN